MAAGPARSKEGYAAAAAAVCVSQRTGSWCARKSKAVRGNLPSNGRVAQCAERESLTRIDTLYNDDEVDWAKGPPASYAKAMDSRILRLAVPALLSALISPAMGAVDIGWVSACLTTTSLAALGPALAVEDWIFEILKTIQ
eukprot:4587254-Amphidinium_carterae.1